MGVGKEVCFADGIELAPGGSFTDGLDVSCMQDIFSLNQPIGPIRS